MSSELAFALNLVQLLLLAGFMLKSDTTVWYLSSLRISFFFFQPSLNKSNFLPFDFWNHKIVKLSCGGFCLCVE